MPETPEPLSARYFALLYSPAPQRPVLEALFGIEREVSESLRPGLDHHVAHSRLQWWREECERTVGGRPVHPLTRALVEALGAAKPTDLTGLIDVAVWDLAGATFETRREFTAYCERWAAAMIEPVGASTGASGSVGTSKLRAIGVAVREIELLGDLDREAHRGRLRLPLDELELINVEPGTLAKPPWPAAVVNLLRARHNALRADLTRAFSSVDREQQPMLRGLIVWAALAARSSERSQRALPDRRAPQRLDAVADSWLAWRIARKATRGRFRLN